MKILLVNKFHYRKGGSETYYFALAEVLRSKGHEVLCFAMKNEKNLPCEQTEFFVDSVEYNGEEKGKLAQLKSAVKLLYSFEAKQKFEKLVQKEKPDIVHLNLVHRQITLSIVDVCKKYNIPVVFTQHDLICVCPAYTCLSPDGICEECLKGSFLPCLKRKCIKGSTAKSALGMLEAVLYSARGSYQKIDAYITPSAFYKGLLEKAAFTKSPVIHMANFLPVNAVFNTNGVHNGRMLYLGRLSKEKGIATLLKAMSLCPDAYLDIAGEGPERNSLEHLSKELNLENRVRFLGYLSGEPLAKLRRECMAVVLPSEWYENGPYSIMEALADGRPVLGSNIGGIPEMVEDDKNGFIFEPFDHQAIAQAILRLYKLDSNEYARMSEAAVCFARNHFDADHYADNILELYKSLCGKNKAAERN